MVLFHVKKFVNKVTSKRTECVRKLKTPFVCEEGNLIYFREMQRLVLIAFLFSSFLLHSQSLKKKYTGTFTGEIPAYFLPVENGAVIEVNATSVSVILQKSGEVFEQIGSLQLKGKIVTSTSTKETLTFEVDFNEQLLNVKYKLNKKTNTLERIGFYPQPNCLLKKGL